MCSRQKRELLVRSWQLKGYASYFPITVFAILAKALHYRYLIIETLLNWNVALTNL